MLVGLDRIFGGVAVPPMYQSQGRHDNHHCSRAPHYHYHHMTTVTRMISTTCHSKAKRKRVNQPTLVNETHSLLGLAFHDMFSPVRRRCDGRRLLRALKHKLSGRLIVCHHRLARVWTLSFSFTGGSVGPSIIGGSSVG